LDALAYCWRRARGRSAFGIDLLIAGDEPYPRNSRKLVDEFEECHLLVTQAHLAALIWRSFNESLGRHVSTDF
jgi:hypothetical protein